MSVKTASPRGVMRTTKTLTAGYRRNRTVVSMPADLLDIGIRFMKELKYKARAVSLALKKAKIPHAIIGGLAVAAHVGRVNESAERNTLDLDILLYRADLQAASKALEPLGYRYRRVMNLHAFMPKSGKPKFEDGVHIVWSDEKVRPDYPHAAPALDPHDLYVASNGVNYLSLEELLRMKLTSFRLKDQVHIQDMLQQKLITRKIEHALPADLQARLEHVKKITENER